jgi:hypothetical protein
MKVKLILFDIKVPSYVFLNQKACGSHSNDVSLVTAAECYWGGNDQKGSFWCVQPGIFLFVHSSLCSFLLFFLNFFLYVNHLIGVILFLFSSMQIMPLERMSRQWKLLLEKKHFHLRTWYVLIFALEILSLINWNCPWSGINETYFPPFY